MRSRAFRSPGRAIALLLDDVTEREEMLELVRWRAAHDELTGLANRTQLVTTATAVLDEGRRAALLIIDLNGFKEVNDTLGHPAGDHHLKTIAARLALMTDRQDVVATTRRRRVRDPAHRAERRSTRRGDAGCRRGVPSTGRPPRCIDCQ